MIKRREKRNSLQRFTGIIVPAQWDASGKAIKIAIATTEEEEYTIASEKKGAELFSLIRKRVEVAGTVQETDGEAILVVDEYTLKEDSGCGSTPEANSMDRQIRVRRTGRKVSSEKQTAASKDKGGKQKKTR